MANILYGVNGEGSGHSTRAKEVIAHLQAKGHKVRVVSFDRGLRNLTDSFDVTEIFGFRFAYVNNRMRYRRTLAKNLITAPRAARSLARLLRLAEDWKIDLVITGTHGRGKVQKLVIGSVAEEIFRKSDCAVLTVGPKVPTGLDKKEVELNHILFATDFGPGAEKAAAYAFSLAQEHNATLTLLHVIETAAAHTEESVARLREINVIRMHKMLPEGSENWCHPEFRARFGAAVEEILISALETKADLIVMGAKARNSQIGLGF